MLNRCLDLAEKRSLAATHDLSGKHPAGYDRQFYTFEKYVTKHRLLTFWHQLSEILRRRPKSVLEIGPGPGLIAGYLRHLGIDCESLDINPALQPTYIGSVVDLNSVLGGRTYEFVVCARVLHHLPFEELPSALEQLAMAAERYVLITFPVEDFRLYAFVRATGTAFKGLSLRLPRSAKRILKRIKRIKKPEYSSLWKVGDEEVDEDMVITALNRSFQIEESYRLPEDMAHWLVVLKPI